MSRLLEINTSGKKVPVYSVDSCRYEPSKQVQIGYLNPREAYVFDSTDGNHYLFIYFLDGNGRFTRGVIYDPTGDTYSLTPAWFYQYGSVKLDGNTYRTYYMRKTMPVYYADGRKWGSVAAGSLVATNGFCNCGEEHPNWVAIDYVKGTDGNWYRVGYTSDKYGFVDTGITTNSLASGIAFYGNW